VATKQQEEKKSDLKPRYYKLAKKVQEMSDALPEEDENLRNLQ